MKPRKLCQGQQDFGFRLPQGSRTASASPADTSAASSIAVASPSQDMRQAISDYKGGKLEDAVTRFQRLRASPSLTPEQRMTVQDAIAAVMVETYGRAAKGDSQAIQAVKQYEMMQTMRH